MGALMRVYWPWWLFPVAFAIWFIKTTIRLTAWPFQAASRPDHRHRVHVRVRIVENDEKPAPPQTGQDGQWAGTSGLS